MFSNKFKILLAGSLLIVAAALLTIKLNYGSESGSENGIAPVTLTAEQYKKLVPNELDTIFYSFGLKNEWIKSSPASVKTTGKKPKKDSTAIPENLWFYKEVLVPQDLSLSAVNYELSNFFGSMKLSEIVNEDPKTRDLNIDVYHSEDSSKKILGKIKLSVTDGISRDAADVCIVLNNVTRYKPEELSKILESPEKFALILPVNFENTDLQAAIMESGKDYLLYYSIGDENDFESDFRQDLDEKQWKNKIRSVASEFPEASAVLISNNKKLYKFEGDIIEHFLKYRSNVFRDSAVIKFNPDLSGEKKIYDLFSNILSASSRGNKSLTYLVDFTPQDFTNYEKEVNNMRKRGYKFISYKEILRKDKKNKTDAVQPQDSTKTDSIIKGKGKTADNKTTGK